MNTTTELPPCCLRVHPQNPEIAVLGTYKLEENGSRHGSLDVYTTKNGHFERLSSTKTASAVLDLKVSPADASLWVLAHSTGNISVWRFEDEKLEMKQNMDLFEEDVLVTSVFFDPKDANRLLATLTSGEAAIVDLQNGTFDLLETPHSLECWTGAFGEEGAAQNVVFTGGDDAKLIAHDLRQNEKIWASTRHHDAGVVLILCPGKEWRNPRSDCLWTGSYDDNLRVFDLRKIDTDEGPSLFPSLLPQELHKTNLGGGVWRLIPGPDLSVLACCMYKGAYILKTGENEPQVGKFFKGKHESMVYGGDWSGKDALTCLFYDNVVEKWASE